jgi:hypothetical protein
MRIPRTASGFDDSKMSYSFGTYRAEIIARGLIEVASRKQPCALPDPITCAGFVADRFDRLGIDPCSPHMKGNISLNLPMPPPKPTRRWSI